MVKFTLICSASSVKSFVSTLTKCHRLRYSCAQTREQRVPERVSKSSSVSWAQYLKHRRDRRRSTQTESNICSIRTAGCAANAIKYVYRQFHCCLICRACQFAAKEERCCVCRGSDQRLIGARDIQSRVDLCDGNRGEPSVFAAAYRKNTNIERRRKALKLERRRT